MRLTRTGVNQKAYQPPFRTPNAVLTGWNTGMPPSTGNAIPEPGSVLLLTLGFIRLTTRR